MHMKTLTNPYLATLLISLTAKVAMADRLTDPTRPTDAKETAQDAYKGVRLEAILRSEDRLLAIVNGKIVRAGDRIGDTRIDEIQHDAVRYTRAGRSHVARLANKSISVRKNVAQHEDET
jgi:hypothetical protein